MNSSFIIMLQQSSTVFYKIIEHSFTRQFMYHCMARTRRMNICIKNVLYVSLHFISHITSTSHVWRVEKKITKHCHKLSCFFPHKLFFSIHIPQYVTQTRTRKIQKYIFAFFLFPDKNVTTNRNRMTTSRALHLSATIDMHVLAIVDAVGSLGNQPKFTISQNRLSNEECLCRLNQMLIRS